MTNEELNRQISELREPLSSLEPMPDSPEAREAFPDVSKEGCWYLATRPEWHWKARSWTDSEHASAVLRGELLDSKRRMEDIFEDIQDALEDYAETSHPWSFHFKHAIAQAWLRSKGAR